MTRACPDLPSICLKRSLRLARRDIVSHRRGSAAVEFAMLTPVFLVFVLGIVCYGSYFWLAHSIQQLANDAARSAVAGLTSSERQSLAQSTLNAEISNYSMLNPALATVTYQGTKEAFAINISYNAANSPFWVAASLVPMPSSTIVRSAAVRLAGF